MDYKDTSREIWTRYNSCNWNHSEFSKEKAYLCSLFSNLAYEHLPSFELNQNSRVKIIPSENYQRKFLAKEAFSIAGALEEMDLADNFIIEGENLIIIGVRIRQTLFITIRGTQSLNDFLVDIDFVKVYHQSMKYMFHSGFLSASYRERSDLLNHLSRYSNCDIYFTGHSLGGAIAAITFNLLSIEYRDFLSLRGLDLKSCYTFGMPRYGNSNVVKDLVTPYQIYNPDDIVPLVPPKSFGYRNVPFEYRLTTSLIFYPNRGKSTIMRLWGLMTINDIKAHFMEEYCRRMKSIL